MIKTSNKDLKKKSSSLIYWVGFFVFLWFMWGMLGEKDQLNQTMSNTSTIQNPQEKKTYIPEPQKNDATLIEGTTASQEEDLTNYEEGKFTRDFDWDYNGYTYSAELNLYPNVYQVFKDRERTRDYDLFASDYYSKEFIHSITQELVNYGKNNGLTHDQIPYFIVSFVQNLPYTSDKVTTGFDEYPRFPYETIYDDGGDCEDTSILAAAMLNDLGYGTALIQLPGHMAVGVKCDGTWGAYYTYNDVKYCYLETTGKNWNVGQIPPEYQNARATIKPIVERPSLDVGFTSKYEYNWHGVYTDVNVTVRNLGSEQANNVKIYVALQTQDESKVWEDIQSDYLQLEPEDSYWYTVTNLHSPTGEPFRIYVRAYGDNVVSDEAVSDWIYWK